MASANGFRRKSTSELCQWLRDSSGLNAGKVERAVKVITEQEIDGSNFLSYTWQKWKIEGLPGGVAESLVQLAQQVLAADESTTGQSSVVVQTYSLLSTLMQSILKQSKTSPSNESKDAQLLAVDCSDFLINQEMEEGFRQYFYLRDEAKREIKFLDEFLHKPSPRVALIGGTPGSGKSLTLFTWAWQKSTIGERSFVFITFLGSPSNFPVDFRFGYFQEGIFYYISSTFHFFSAADVKELQLFILALKLENAVLVLDGLTNFTKEYHSCFKNDFKKMYFVTSQQVFLGDVDKSVARESFRCFPWKLEDYNQVCHYDLFWRNLGADIFDSTSMMEVEEDTAKEDDREKIVVNARKEMIHRKYFYAGYSACWMFRQAESTLPQLVESYAGKVKDVEKYLFGTIWDKIEDAVNHILVEESSNSFVIVSFYAAKILALISRDSSKVANYIRSFAITVNDARMIGIAYEVHIRNLLSTSRGSFLVVKDKESREHRWTVTSFTYFKAVGELRFQCGDLGSGDYWFFPVSFMQGEFDMFQVRVSDYGEYKVRFVQVTIAETHSFKEDYFVDVLSTFRWVVLPTMQLVEVEVVGLVPEYRLRKGFKYNPRIPVERVYPNVAIPQQVLHCTVPDDGNWLQNPNNWTTSPTCV